MPTIHQRGALIVNDWQSFGAHPGEALDKCVQAGYARVDVLLNPDHPTNAGVVPRSYIENARKRGAVVWGRVWADDFLGPQAMHDFLVSERLRLRRDDGSFIISGFGINAEDGWEAKDQSTSGWWSSQFLTEFRRHPVTAKLGLYLDLYNGCGGIALRKWQDRGARLVCQTHHEGQTHEWPIDGYMPWARQYGWTKPSMIKPELGTYSPLPNRAEQLAAMKRAGTLGLLAYYAEGAGDPAAHLIPLLQEARAAGVCA